MALVHGEDEDRWYFTKEELKKTPSVLSGIDIAKELSYRQQSANLIQDMGQRLSVYPSFNLLSFLCHSTGLCIRNVLTFRYFLGRFLLLESIPLLPNDLFAIHNC